MSGGDMAPGNRGGWADEPGVVRFPDGRRLRGTGARRPRNGVPPPQFAVYLLGHPPPDPVADHRWVRWRDFGLPHSRAEALDALREAHRRAADQRVEIACTGGIGRTGTAMAVVAMIAGIDRDRAVEWVREHYHPRAVETPWQRAWIRSVAVEIGGQRPATSAQHRPPRPRWRPGRRHRSQTD